MKDAQHDAYDIEDQARKAGFATIEDYLESKHLMERDSRSWRERE